MERHGQEPLPDYNEEWCPAQGTNYNYQYDLTIDPNDRRAQENAVRMLYDGIPQGWQPVKGSVDPPAVPQAVIDQIAARKGTQKGKGKGAGKSAKRDVPSGQIDSMGPPASKARAEPADSAAGDAQALRDLERIARETTATLVEAEEVISETRSIAENTAYSVQSTVDPWAM